MGNRLGMDAKLYYCELGAAEWGTPSSWTEIDNARDVTLNLETAEADVTTRGNNGWRQTVGTLKDGSVEFQMVWDTEDDAFGAIRDAWLHNDAIGLAALDRELTDPDAEGLVADFAITAFSRSENLEESIMVNVTAKPTYSATPAKWVPEAAS